MLTLMLMLACAGDPATEPSPDTPAAGAGSASTGAGPGGPPPSGGDGRPGPPPNGGNGGIGPAGPPPGGQPGGAPGPMGPPPGGMGPGGPGPAGGGGSGAALQDPSGFPGFHDWPAPTGPVVPAGGSWGAPVQLTSEPAGGYRPQVAVGNDGEIHVVYYRREDAGDLIQHQRSFDGAAWTEPLHLGFDDLRNWGPDLVVRDDGEVVLVFDHAQADFRSRGYLTRYRDGAWSTPEALTADDGGEIGSGHVAHGPGNGLGYVWIGKPLDATAHFRAHWRWFDGSTWGEPVALTDGAADAWHTNVERRPDGSMLVGFDVGTGGAATTLYVAEARDGKISPLEDLTATGEPGERPHFAFGADGVDHITWFHKDAGKPVHVYVRSGHPGAWGPVSEPSQGFGGFHFDPEIAINAAGVRVLVWGWDAGKVAEMVYSVDKGDGWSAPVRVAEIGWGKPGLASLVAGPDGTFHVVWNQGVRGRNEVYYASLVVD